MCTNFKTEISNRQLAVQVRNFGDLCRAGIFQVFNVSKDTDERKDVENHHRGQAMMAA